MTWVVTAVVGSQLIGGYLQGEAAQGAAETQAGSARYAADVQKQMFDIVNAQQAPYRQAGYGALTRIGELLPGLTTPITAQEIQNLPGFQFATQQGIGAARQNMNVGGGGSNVDRAAQKFAIDYTTGVAMPQVLQQRQNIYNTLAGIAGIGQTAQSQTNQAAMTTGTNIGQAAIGAGSALAAGQVGQANAYANALGNIGNSAFMYSLLKG